MFTWQGMERQFHTQLFKAEPEVCIIEFSRVTHKWGTSDFFYYTFQKDEEYMQDLFTKNGVYKNGANRFGYRVEEEIQGNEIQRFL